jgi:acyl-CoA thioester hydrolase
MSEDGRFSIVQRVRWGDLDALQHMNNVEFLRFFETARIDYIRRVIPGHTPGDGKQFGFIFAEAHINFRSPAFLDQQIRTYVWASEIRRSAVRIDFEMVVDGDGRRVADGWGMLVGYDYAAGKPQPLPEAVRESIQPELRDAVG